jgi:nucleoid-associated protein YgaU
MSQHAKQGHAVQRLGAALAIIAALFTAGFIGHTVAPATTTLVHPTPTVTVPAPTPTPTHPTPTHPSPKPPAAPTPHTNHLYVVHQGDTLWSIAAHIYHNPLAWHMLWQHNLKVIGGNPNLIHSGQVLQLE